MKIEVDRKVLSEKLNELIDVPYVPESVEAKAFETGVDAAAEALIRLAERVDSLAEYGVTVSPA